MNLTFVFHSSCQFTSPQNSWSSAIVDMKANKHACHSSDCHVCCESIYMNESMWQVYGFDWWCVCALNAHRVKYMVRPDAWCHKIWDEQNQNEMRAGAELVTGLSCASVSFHSVVFISPLNTWRVLKEVMLLIKKFSRAYIIVFILYFLCKSFTWTVSSKWLKCHAVPTNVTPIYKNRVCKHCILLKINLFGNAF